ncbi:MULTISPECIES: hypothetical protein [Deinococcus]|uniref:Uncharacterized protein n=1 Tax=Deinococcus marmoris TaxID=249408 RepID=A0A1U7NR53_9DEIO|nr:MULTISPECIES: hypothetical protein [Deinococcus]OLV15400.1 hypothetical protein BOO71_0014953 [Deinococcus marmoris]QFP76895.1 hypothetical protein DAAJ005_10850 [Deinococcus sp. AJ005]
MTIQQTVDWASPDGQLLVASVYRQMQRRILRGPLIALALLTIIGVIWAVYYRNIFFLLAAAALGLFVWWNARRSMAQVLLTARNSGVTEFRLDQEDSTLHIVNAQGSFRLPLTKMGGVTRYQGALSVQYGGNATMMIPDGPVRTALER